MFVKNVIKLTIGTSLAQIIIIFASPVLTRIFDPTTFGIFSVFSSIIMIFGVISCLRYELTIVLPEDEGRAETQLFISLFVCFIISILLVPIFILFGNQITSILNISEISMYTWLIPIATFLNGLILSLTYWNMRKKKFENLSISRISNAASYNGLAIGGGSLGFNTAGTLIGASIIGQFLAALSLSFSISKGVVKKIIFSLRFSDIREGLVRYKRFPIYDTWAALLGTFVWQLPILILSAFFSPLIVGYYSLSFRVLQLPTSIIGSSVGQVFFQRASEVRHKSNEELSIFVKEITKKLFLLGFFPTILLLFFGKDLFIVIFGSNWSEAGVYSQIMAIWIFLYFITSPIGTLFSMLEKQQISLMIGIVSLSIQSIVLLVGSQYLNATFTIILFSFVGSIIYFISFCILLNLVHIRIFDGIKFFSYFIITIFPAIICLLLINYFVHSPFIIFLISTISIILYYFILIQVDDEIKGMIREVFKRTKS